MSVRIEKRRVIAALALLAVLAGCGWHLRGARNLPAQMAKTYIEGASQTGELVRHIERDLKSAGVQVVTYPAADAAVLRIQPQSGLRTLSVGADGKAREYEVYYTVGFSVRRADSEFEIPEQRITLTRDFVFDPLEALAVHEERDLLEQSMERDLARLIVERLSAADAVAKGGATGESRPDDGAGQAPRSRAETPAESGAGDPPRPGAVTDDKPSDTR